MSFRVYASLVCSACLVVLLASTTQLWAGPTFLNRQAFPISLALHEMGPFHNNYLRTFEVWTQWDNDASVDVKVNILFTFFDSDSGGSRMGEDGKDDTLMSVMQSVTIPSQVSNWGKTFYLTAIGGKINEGFDHLEEGASLELYVDAQIMSIQYLSQ
ncbi:MAG: hypothetical protein MRJ96_02235 [Nitrospirales bacterium]|nr:hypothetical protein [Nitrospira sp.]MDR4500263.1 hypothetical protein [Nitrospirales bacterium]